MAEIVLLDPFFDLPSIGLESKVNEFTLDTERFEREMGKRNGGLDLRKMKAGSLSGRDLAHYQQILPHHYLKPNPRIRVLIELAKRYPGPISKRVADAKELERDILTMYQVAYAHYAISKHVDLTNGGFEFPDGCCGKSARALTVSLMMHGFLNATAVDFICHFDHTYVMAPFVMEEPAMQGVILVDPTSDIIGQYKGKWRRNLVTIKEGMEWDYVTRYLETINFYPHFVLNLGCLSKEGIMGNDGCLTDKETLYFEGCKRYLEQAYANPVELEMLKSFPSLDNVA